MNNAPSAVVVASKITYHAVYVQRCLFIVDFRIYSSLLIVGVQLDGALKNPLAIGADMVEGAGYCNKMLAAFVTRSSLELQKLCLTMGGQSNAISQKAEDLLNETNVEDVLTAKVAVYFAKKCGLDLPIFRTVNAMIKGHEQVQVLLMNWPLQSEI
ncbi:unnamed protein product [Peronospora farinosa]|uniref:glycerol-3-phosphate dehydrogenase (NAD(+)) n=1 Tax=Peronospora farinosa TaxID=134698 RepID=A0AAV0T459_9STRA|nr:unnamed protein product [Peronospora farinosa]